MTQTGNTRLTRAGQNPPPHLRVDTHNRENRANGLTTNLRHFGGQNPKSSLIVGDVLKIVLMSENGGK